jgi:hypothetical protein
MSYIYIYIELLVKPEILTSYIYGPTFGNAESRLFLFTAESYPVAQLCVNTLLATKVTRSTDAI